MADYKTNPRECSPLVNDYLAAWYDGTSLDLTTNKWYDKSGNNRTGIITGSGIHIFHNFTPTHELYLNNEPVPFGYTDTDIVFGEPYFMLPNHTIFTLSKYLEIGQKNRIIQGTEYNFMIGHDYNASGLCVDGEMLTQCCVSQFGNDWLLSSQRRDLYRGNAINLTIHPQNDTIPDWVYDMYPQFNNWRTRLAINKGATTVLSAIDSDWSCAEIIVVNAKLNILDIECVETYLNCKYDLGLHYSCLISTPSQTSTSHPTIATEQQPTVAVHNGKGDAKPSIGSSVFIDIIMGVIVGMVIWVVIVCFCCCYVKTRTQKKRDNDVITISIVPQKSPSSRIPPKSPPSPKYVSNKVKIDSRAQDEHNVVDHENESDHENDDLWNAQNVLNTTQGYCL